MKLLLLLTALFCFCFTGFSQDDKAIKPKYAANSIYLGLGNNASVISLNYDRLFLRSRFFFLSAATGVGFNKSNTFRLFSEEKEQISFLTIPYHATANIGYNLLFLELGVDGGLFIGPIPKKHFTSPLIGLRFQPLKKRWVTFRVTVRESSTFYFHKDHEIWIPPVSASLGIIF